MEARPARAVVLGLGINGLGVVRALGRAGIPVVGAWSGRDEAGRLSRYLRPVRLDAQRSPLALDDLLHALGGATDRPVLFATCDADAAWINEQQEVLQEHFRFHTVGRDLFRRLESKRAIVELLGEQRIEAPRTEHFESLRQLEERAASLPMPILVKPVDTYRRTLPAGAKNELFSDRASLLAFVRSHPAHLPDMVFQEVVVPEAAHRPGDHGRLAAVVVEGPVVRIVRHRRSRALARRVVRAARAGAHVPLPMRRPRRTWSYTWA